MFSWKINNSLHYLEIVEMSVRVVKAVFTSHRGGVSNGVYSSLNLGLHTKDKTKNILENRNRIASVLKLDHTEFVAAEQVHGDKIHAVKSENCFILIEEMGNKRVEWQVLS